MDLIIKIMILWSVAGLFIWEVLGMYMVENLDYKIKGYIKIIYRIVIGPVSWVILICFYLMEKLSDRLSNSLFSEKETEE